jgi:undecaprenyl-diphosphatase
VRLLALALTGNAVWYPGWDESLFRSLNLVGTNAVLDVVMVLFTDLALPYVLPLLAVPLWWKGRREQAFDLLVVLALVIVVTEVLKFAFDRARPCDVLPNVNLPNPGACTAEGDPAFPSGHASRIFAVAGFLAVYFKWPVKASAFAVAVVVGISRLYLGVHWPSDVVAGAILGIALALLYVAVARKWKAYQRLRARIVEAVARRLPKRPKTA